MPGYRIQKAASFIRDELTLLLRDLVHDPRVEGLVITEVSMTPDRRIARVYVAHFDSPEALSAGMAGLLSARGVLRRELGRLLHWNYVPELEFRTDNSWHYGQRIDALLKEIDLPADNSDESAEHEDDDSDE
ncbi:MAG: 30S ribosome-binding factor RbfA [Chloroflexi bacterium]|nr:30S ribosome-binding factor RbfA [Chloroflexota bacterium]